jgi:hypothetical protein
VISLVMEALADFEPHAMAVSEEEVIWQSTETKISERQLWLVLPQSVK